MSSLSIRGLTPDQMSKDACVRPEAYYHGIHPVRIIPRAYFRLKTEYEVVPIPAN
jgi:hypothetical protein